MKRLQDRFANTGVLLASISVDPDHDSPAVLKKYAAQFEASPDQWWFLTGPKASTYDLVQNRFKLALAETTASDRTDGAEAFSHSDRLALVDGDRVVGFFESTDELALDELVARARRLAQPAWVLGLPAVNASLNAVCAVFLIAGWFFIHLQPGAMPGSPTQADWSASAAVPLLRRPTVRAHIACMLLAVVTSAVFLTCYLVYHYHAGSMPFRHEGAVKWAYLTILLSHTLLATFGVVPLVTLTLLRAFQRDFVRHARIAPATFVIWLYVSVTGVVIYLLLYHLPVAAAASQSLV